MRKDVKFKLFAALSIILSLLFVSITWGEIDLKKAIIGKWERYDEGLISGTESFEFFEDGTVFTYHTGLKLSAGGDYRFIDKNRIRINLGGLWGLLGPIVCGVSVNGNELILTLPDGKVEKYTRVGTAGKLIESIAERKEEPKPEIAGDDFFRIPVTQDPAPRSTWNMEASLG